MRFFFYGTLMDPDVRRRVLGRDVGRRLLQPATLEGYRRARRRGADYPILCPASGGRIAGILLCSATVRDARRLARYEGGDYIRRRVFVALPSGGNCAAWVFLPRNPVADRSARASGWDYRAWRGAAKRRLLGRNSLVPARKPTAPR